MDISKIKPHANLRSANLYGANLTGADLRSANLYGAILTGANLRSANLYGANLTGADLTRADLRSANLYGANLTGADLRYADLYGANLTGADLRSANLYGANLTGANLTSAKGIIRLSTSEDGYEFFGVRHEDRMMIKAGCRWFTVPEARHHWLNTRKGTELGRERLAFVDALALIAKAKGWTIGD